MKIDLSSALGNAFALIAIVRDVCRQLDMSRESTQNIVDEMTSGDYDDLLTVMDSRFCKIFQFVNDPRPPSLKFAVNTEDGGWHPIPRKTSAKLQSAV